MTGDSHDYLSALKQFNDLMDGKLSLPFGEGSVMGKQANKIFAMGYVAAQSKMRGHQETVRHALKTMAEGQQPD